jgi:hypothetical protein
MAIQRTWWASALVFYLALSAVTAEAAVTEDSFLLRSTGDLVDLCTAAQTDAMYTAASNFCQGFTVGVFRVMQEQDMAQRANHLFCLPSPAPTRNEVIAGFVQWAKADPTRTTQAAADSIVAFLAQQYPCQRRR